MATQMVSGSIEACSATVSLDRERAPSKQSRRTATYSMVHKNYKFEQLAGRRKATAPTATKKRMGMNIDLGGTRRWQRKRHTARVGLWHHSTRRWARRRGGKESKGEAQARTLPSTLQALRSPSSLSAPSSASRCHGNRYASMQITL